MAFTKNKEIPTNVLSVLNPYFIKEDGLFRRIKSNGEFLLKFIDSDESSDFFFQISGYIVDKNNSITFNVLIKPQSGFNVGASQLNVHSSNLDQYFNSWFEQLTRYTKLQGPIEEDFILRQYEDEFFSAYELVDKDADSKSYAYDTQLQIDTFLNDVNLKLEEFKTDQNKAEIDEIQHDIVELREKQTKQTKRIVYKSISKIISKCRKCGFELGKWVLETFIKACAESIVKGYISSKI